MFIWLVLSRDSAWQWGRALICNDLEQAWCEHEPVKLVLPGFTGQGASVEVVEMTPLAGLKLFFVFGSKMISRLMALKNGAVRADLARTVASSWG